MSRSLIKIVLIIVFIVSNNLFAQDNTITSEIRAVTFFYEYGIKQGNFPIKSQIWFKGITENSFSYLNEDVCSFNQLIIQDSTLAKMKIIKGDSLSPKEVEVYIDKKFGIRKKRPWFKRKYANLLVFQTNEIDSIEYTKIVVMENSQSIVFHIFYNQLKDAYISYFTSAIW